MKKILVFCSANDLEEKYTKPSREFAKLIATNGYSLVWGGSDKGIMKLTASTVQENGGKIYGVSMELLKANARVGADEMIIAKDFSERKATMLAKADAIAVLVGGIGTLDEITEVLELKKHDIHNKPIVFLNTENFYEGFKIQLEKMQEDGFLTKTLDEFAYFADTPNEAIEYINKNI